MDKKTMSQFNDIFVRLIEKHEKDQRISNKDFRKEFKENFGSIGVQEWEYAPYYNALSEFQRIVSKKFNWVVDNFNHFKENRFSVWLDII